MRMVVPVDGGTLKALRQQRRLSQQAFAEKSEVAIATIKRIEGAKGVYRCQQLQADRLAKALDVEVEDLIVSNFDAVIDVGEDLELHIERHVDLDALKKAHRQIEALFEVRNRFLKKP
jgi:transcriptional regulator with XRE-family HTH domain